MRLSLSVIGLATNCSQKRAGLGLHCWSLPWSKSLSYKRLQTAFLWWGLGSEERGQMELISCFRELFNSKEPEEPAFGCLPHGDHWQSALRQLAISLKRELFMGYRVRVQKTRHFKCCYTFLDSAGWTSVVPLWWYKYIQENLLTQDGLLFCWFLLCHTKLNL